MKAKAITEEVGVVMVVHGVVEDGVTAAAHGVVEDGAVVEDGVTGVVADGAVVMVDHGAVVAAGVVAGQKNTLMLNLKTKQ
jgi:hypothetical protein